jgi:uncharacterized iron-regulated protein
MTVRPFASSGSIFIFTAATTSAAAGLLIAGCGARAEGGASEGSSALSGNSLSGNSLSDEPRISQRTREGRAGQLLQLAREVGVASNINRSLLVDAGSIEPPRPADAGSAEPGGSEGSIHSGTDAGVDEAGDAGAPVLPPPPSPPPPSPPPPLPRDIVEQAALPLYGLEAGAVLTEAVLWDRLADSQVVCFGEFHDVPAHHYAESRALSELAARAGSGGHSFAVGFEMFQRPFQASLSAFVTGDLGEPELLAQTEYPTRWGYDFSLYRPLLEGARARQLPALALNMRAEITRKIGRTGIESLDPTELAELPELDLQDQEHREYIFGLFGVLPEHAAELGLENVYTAQTVWDETMADTSARWLAERGPGARLLDFAGGAHCHRSAIPRRITRRTGEPALSVHAVFESELADGSFTPEGYDVLVVLDDREGDLPPDASAPIVVAP